MATGLQGMLLLLRRGGGCGRRRAHARVHVMALEGCVARARACGMRACACRLCVRGMWLGLPVCLFAQFGKRVRVDWAFGVMRERRVSRGRRGAAWRRSTLSRQVDGGLLNVRSIRRFAVLADWLRVNGRMWTTRSFALHPRLEGGLACVCPFGMDSRPYV